jgi:hypothetical protein
VIGRDEARLVGDRRSLTSSDAHEKYPVNIVNIVILTAYMHTAGTSPSSKRTNKKSEKSKNSIDY